MRREKTFGPDTFLPYPIIIQTQLYSTLRAIYYLFSFFFNIVIN